MTTVLQYLVIAAVIGLLLFGVALLLFGRGERLAALPARTSPAQLPERGIDGADVRRVRFALALRGYRMSDVDWTLERLADELDRTRAELGRVIGDAVDGPGANEVAGDDADRGTRAAADVADPDPEAAVGSRVALSKGTGNTDSDGTDGDNSGLSARTGEDADPSRRAAADPTAAHPTSSDPGAARLDASLTGYTSETTYPARPTTPGSEA